VPPAGAERVPATGGLTGNVVIVGDEYKTGREFRKNQITRFVPAAVFVRGTKTISRRSRRRRQYGRPSDATDGRSLRARARDDGVRRGANRPFSRRRTGVASSVVTMVMRETLVRSRFGESEKRYSPR